MQSYSVISLICILALISGKTFSSEEAKYTVLIPDGMYEVRHYSPHIVAEVLVSSEFEDAGGEAFGKLFSYISGNNTVQEKIAMTAPVSQRDGGEVISMTAPVAQVREGDTWAVSFMMPSTYTLDSLPKPIDPDIAIRRIPQRYIASVEYSGFWSEKSYLKHHKGLHTWVSDNGFMAIDEPVWARYNAPYTPWFLRRNEILLPIQKPLM